MTVFNLAIYNDWCRVIYDMLKIFQGCQKSLEYYILNCLYILQNYKSFKTQNENNKKSLQKLLHFFGKVVVVVETKKHNKIRTMYSKLILQVISLKRET